jgi:hypothetical protein
MGEITVCAVAVSVAGPSRVFALLKDGATWPQWSLFESFELEQAGRSEPLGIGAVRVFSTKVTRAREEVVELVEGRQLSYTLLTGLPLTDYRADVYLTPEASGGTSIRWQARFRAKYAGTGWFWGWFMKRTLRTIAAQLAHGASNADIHPHP